MSKVQKNWLKSMTGYGQATAQSELGIFELEIQGTNRRFLEVNISLAKPLQRFESALRRQVESRVGRGQVNLSIVWHPNEKNALRIVPNITLAKALKSAYSSLANELGLPFEPRLEQFLREEGILHYEERIKDENEVLSILKGAVDDVLLSFCSMREKEGSWLADDLSMRLETLESNILKIEGYAIGFAEKLQERLEKRVAPFFSAENEEDRSRLMKEIVLYVDKADISEEIVRFKGHLKCFKETIETPFGVTSETRGKKLDFLLQELFREINTIGSKAQDSFIINNVVEIKCEMEKMREQVQNVE